MRKILLTLGVIVCLYANEELIFEREKELKFYANVIHSKGITIECKNAFTDLIKYTLSYNKAFDDFLNNGKKYATEETQVKNQQDYIVLICTKKDKDLIGITK